MTTTIVINLKKQYAKLSWEKMNTDNFKTPFLIHKKNYKEVEKILIDFLDCSNMAWVYLNNNVPTVYVLK